MKNSMIAPNVVSFVRAAIFGCLLFTVSTFGRSNVNGHRLEDKFTSAAMDMVVLTQKDYIQFLRWELPVPNIEEFTFCLWLRSSNLTYPHSIFSYSRNEKDRLVRAWISTHGRSIHLEIGGMEVFREPTSLKENRWYHVCQSWENREGRYAVWLNGRVKAQGYAIHTLHHVIPSNGDIVLGQEYTDFDKGLEEGIEGAVFGFNLLLKSCFDEEKPLQSEIVPRSIPYPSIPYTHRIFQIPRYIVRSISPKTPKRYRYYEEEPRYSVRTKNPTASKGETAYVPLGQQLVEQSYVYCTLGRGSPPIGGPLMLISWSRTPGAAFNVIACDVQSYTTTSLLLLSPRGNRCRCPRVVPNYVRPMKLVISEGTRPKCALFSNVCASTSVTTYIAPRPT